MNEGTLQKLYTEASAKIQQEAPPDERGLALIALHVGLDFLRCVGSIANSLERIAVELERRAP